MEEDFVLLPGKLTDPLTFKCKRCGKTTISAALWAHARMHHMFKFTVDITAIISKFQRP